MSKDILVIHPGALGDVLLAVPALRVLRTRHPHSRCILLSQEPAGRLLLQCGLVDDWISIESATSNALFSGTLDDLNNLWTKFHNCAIAIGWLEDNNEEDFKRTLGRLKIPQIILRSPFHPSLKSIHQIDRFIEAIGEMDPDSVAQGRLELPRDVVKKGQEWIGNYGLVGDRPLVAIHAGSGSPLKCTQPGILAEVMDRLHQEGVQMVLIEGPADRELVRAVLCRTAIQPAIICHSDLTIVAAVLSLADVYIGHDSGITHLAGLLGVQTIAIFGPTDPDRWAPRGDHVIVLRGSPCHCLNWESVAHCRQQPCLAIAPTLVSHICLTRGRFAKELRVSP